MSVTTTANPTVHTLQSVLADYDLHHTTADEAHDTSLNAHPAPSPTQQNPSDWPTEHRRVPAYRPVNTQLDQSERRVYQNGVERTFVIVMFTGVLIESVSIGNGGRVEADTNGDTDYFESVEGFVGEGMGFEV
jgi:hypothetical protein